jgi:hypothetical protein
VGDRIRFSTRIRVSSGPFPGIEWSDLIEGRGLISFILVDAVPLDVIPRQDDGGSGGE